MKARKSQLDMLMTASGSPLFAEPVFIFGRALRNSLYVNLLVGLHDGFAWGVSINS